MTITEIETDILESLASSIKCDVEDCPEKAVWAARIPECCHCVALVCDPCLVLHQELIGRYNAGIGFTQINCSTCGSIIKSPKKATLLWNRLT